MKYAEITVEARRSLFHGSREEFPVGFILRPQPHGYVHGVAGDEFDAGIRRVEGWLERFRPPSMISRLAAVFLSRSIAAILHAGGHDEHVYQVEPIGTCERSCLWWYDSIENYLLDDVSIPEDQGQLWAENYWTNKPPPRGKPATYEYRCRSARILRIVR